MKAKVVGLPILAMHIMVLAGFSVMQGCKTAKVGEVPQDQPVVLPADDLSGAKAPVLPPVSLPVPSAKTYNVQKGDTLSSIASAHGTTWKKLAELNNLSNPNQLKVGQEIRISESAAGTSSASVSGKHTAPVSSRPIPGSIKQGSSYVIQKGDSLSSIAKRSGLTVSEIKAANSLPHDSLVVGKSLTIPKKGAKASVAKAAPAKSANPAPAATKAAVAPAALPAPAPLADAASTGSVAAATTAAAPAVPAAAAPVAKAAGAPVYEHVLYPGETLDDVARQYGSSQQEIMKLNNITDAASIKPGTKLLVPIPE